LTEVLFVEYPLTDNSVEEFCYWVLMHGWSKCKWPRDCGTIKLSA